MKNKLYVKAAASIAHYGTKGMQWGVRKKRGRSSSESRVTKSLRKKKAFQLTNAELKKVNARLSLEKQYSQLNPTTASKAKKVITSMAGSMAKQVLSNVVTEAATTYAKKIVTGGG
jgi:hypothetical protein